MDYKAFHCITLMKEYDITFSIGPKYMTWNDSKEFMDYVPTLWDDVDDTRKS